MDELIFKDSKIGSGLGSCVMIPDKLEEVLAPIEPQPINHWKLTALTPLTKSLE
jgi:hypothetical protein